ncbi:MAG: ATP-binding protein [Cellulophaga sp.]
MKYRNCSLLFFFFLHLIFLCAQEEKTVPFSSNSEIGLPYIQNYSTDDYAANTQNFSVIQSEKGFIYVGNADGVLEYDGVNWRLIELPNQGPVYSLVVYKENKIFVGGFNELGYLEADTLGNLHFISLKKHLSKINEEFQMVYSISILNTNIYFHSKEKIFVWNGTNFEIIKTNNPGINFIKNIDNKIYSVSDNTIIETLVGSHFKKIVNTASIGIKNISGLLPYNGNQLLILSAFKGLFIYRNENLIPFSPESTKYLSKNYGQSIIELSNGWYAIGTKRGGLVVLEANGSIVKIIDQFDGLIDNTIIDMFEDYQNGLWLATYDGVSRVELLSPYSIFDERHGVDGYVNRIYKHQGKLYIANYKGVLTLETTNNIKKTNSYKLINEYTFNEKSTSQAFYFMALSDSLFSASRAGTHIIVNHKIVQEFNYTSSALFRSSHIPNRIFIGLNDGLASLKYENGNWIDDGRIKGIKDDIREIVEDANGNLWLESQTDGVWKVSFNKKDIQNPTVKHFKANRDLPNGWLFLKSIRGEVLFNIDNRVYKYKETLDSIIENPSFGKLFNLSGKIAVKKELNNGTIWMAAKLNKEDKGNSKIRVIKQVDDTYIVEKIDNERISQDVGVALFSEENGIVWYGGSGGIIRHDLTIEGNSQKDFNTHIRKVTYQNDSLLFGGVKSNHENKPISYKENAFRFEYAATSFDDESQNQFQVYLEGFDEDWSSWTSETQKDYTNIPEGDYNFKVRSRNVFNHLGKEDSYFFTIVPPWYRTWWMYLIYGLLAIASFMGISQYRSKELLRKNEGLENVVRERTTEIQQKNELLNQQTEKLVQLNDARTQLYANITHEFRTPLTVILGMTETLKADAESKKLNNVEKSLEMIKRNGKKLLQLVNEMLDLAKLESGTMELHLVQTNIVPFVKYLSESFHSLAETKKINLTVYSEIEDLEMDFDTNKMSSIISNLLSNAIKFTPEHGKIVVHLNQTSKNDMEYFIIKIKDNGIGIAEEEKDNLFNRFYQVDNSSTRQGDGTGIGLSLVKEFTELMNGTITVKSSNSKGSTFTVQLPVTHTAVKTTGAKITGEASVVVSNTENNTTLPHLGDNPELPLVLIIEDNEDVAYYLRTCLKGKYQTIHAVNGIIGIEMALKNIPDIIISDVMMPGKDGFEVCAILKSNELTDHIPIILLTAKTTIKDRLTGLSHGADAYLAKPFVKAELFTRLDQLVSLRKKLLNKFQNNGFDLLLKKRDVTPETKFLHKAIQLIHEDISDSDFGTVQLAFKLHLSESQVYRKLKAITDKSTAVFIRSIRLQRGKELLQTTDKTVSEIAYEVGFNDPSWFSKAFKEEFGFAPSEA